jgi:glutathione S-transferase
MAAFGFFDSTAILLYLSEKIGQFLSGNDPRVRAEAVKGRCKFKAEMDEEARRIMFRHIVKT